MATPDTLLYHYQSLFAGGAAIASALLAGAFLLVQSGRQHKNELKKEEVTRSEARRVYSVVFYTDLNYLQTELGVFIDQIDEVMDLMRSNGSVVEKFEDMSLPGAVGDFYEDWKSQVGFDSDVIAALGVMRIALREFEVAVRPLRNATLHGVTSLPLFRSTVQSQDLQSWRELLKDCIAAAKNLSEVIDVVLEAIGAGLPSSLVRAIKRGDVHEIALAGMSREAQASGPGEKRAG